MVEILAPAEEDLEQLDSDLEELGGEIIGILTSLSYAVIGIRYTLGNGGETRLLGLEETLEMRDGTTPMRCPLPVLLWVLPAG